MYRKEQPLWLSLDRKLGNDPIANNPIIPNKKTAKYTKNRGDFDAYVRTVIAFEAGSYTTLDEFNAKMHLNLNTTDWTWEWVETPMTIGGGSFFVATATYNKVLAPSALTEISLSQIALDKTATNDDVAGFGDTFQVLVQSQAVQAAGFADPDTALDEAFGEIPPAPFENDNPTSGTDLRTAAHYLNGKTTNTKITTSVNKMVFGLNADHADIVNNYEGTLVDIEQDVDVYAYYVPNGSMYDLYFLANSDIYFPKDSGRLFQGMTNLTSVDTTNLNTGRAELMNHVFYQCGKLTDIDVSDFDLRKATTIKSMFNDCVSLTTLDVADWEFPNVVDMSFLFRFCKKLDGLDVSKWDTSNAENMSYIFFQCESLTAVDVSNFDTSNATDMQFMFKNCYKLENIDVSDWDTGNCVYFNSMFSGDSKAMSLKGVDISGWDMSSAQTINHMFYACSQITEVDMSNWDVRNVVSMSHMFSDCWNLEKVDFTGWETPKLNTVDALFNDCHSLKRVDVSSLDTANVVEFSQAFEYCISLEEIIGLDKWVTTSGQDFGEMFSGCRSLKAVDLSSFDTTNAQDSYVNPSNKDGNDRFHYFLTGCNSLEKVILGAKFSFDGDGSFTKWTFEMPSATNVAGWDGYWYNVDTGVGYLPSEIPEETAATYVAVKP